MTDREPSARSRLTARRLGAGAAALFLTHALLASPFLEDVAVAFGPQGFAERRVEQAFVGTDMAQVQARLTALIGPDAPVALAPSIQEQELFRQRFHEALYPRPIRDDAPNVLVPARPGSSGERRVLGLLSSYDLILVGPLEPDAPREAPVAQPPATAGAAALAALASGLSWLGLGLFALRLARSARRDVPAPLDDDGRGSWSAVALAGLLVGALTSSLATWLAIPVPAPLVAALGLLALGLLLLGPRPTLARPDPWSAAPVTILALLAARLAAAPIARWDGRSIWLFHARRLWQHGHLVIREAQDPATVFSHPDYPLAWPAILAFPSSWATHFDERLAGIGAALAIGIVGLRAFGLARDALGGPAAAGLVAGLAVHVTRVTAGGYADGFLALTLLTAFLSLRAGRQLEGGLALALASLTKVEGLPLGALVALAGTLAAPRGRRGPGPILGLLAGLAHVAWTRAHGLDSLLKGGTVASSLGALGTRLGEVVARAPELLASPGDTGVRGLLPAALVALLPTMALLWIPARRRAAAPALALSLAAAALAAGAVAALPEPVEWFVATALDRLLLHAGTFAVLALLLALSADRAAGSAASPALAPDAGGRAPAGPASPGGA